MIRRLSRRAHWALAFWALLAASNAHALQGGDPNDPNSCYSHCGDVAGSWQKCFCDTACESFGDCCVDKHEYCAPGAAKPVCGLVDDTKTTSSLVCGSDLAASFVHKGNVEMMFGDTSQFASTLSTTCTDPGSNGLNDDMQARFSGVTKPTWVPSTAAAFTPTFGSCKVLAGAANVLSFDSQPVGTAFTYAPLKLQKQVAGGGFVNLPLTLLNTPGPGVSDGFNAFVIFVAPLDDQLINQLAKHVYIAKRSGDATVAQRTQYTVIKDLGLHAAFGSPHTNFGNQSATRVNSLSDFDTPSAAGGGEFLVFGRPSYTTTATEPNAMYLMRAPIPAAGLVSWDEQYFNSLDSNGQPVWSNAANAQPILTSDFTESRQFDVKWIKEIKKWVMVYGGDEADWLRCDNPVFPCNTAACRALCASPPSDQPRHGAIHMRTADFPWGPWTRPTPLLWREAMGGFYQCDAWDPFGCDLKNSPLFSPPSYQAGDWETGIPQTVNQCRTTFPNKHPTSNAFLTTSQCGLRSQRGNMYAPNLMPSWTTTVPAPLGGVAQTTVYFTVSTWHPYYVVLAAADLVTPKATYPLQMQVRHALTSKMIGGSAAPAFTRNAGGTDGGTVSFRIDKLSPTAGDQMRLGDVVVLRHVSDGGKLLARNSAGTGVLYLTDPGGTPPASAQWKLTGTQNGTLVVPGSTSVFFSVPSAPTQFLKSNTDLNNLQLAIGPSDSFAAWRFTYYCQTIDPDGAATNAAPDVCGR
jgi:hypothetical protein